MRVLLSIVVVLLLVATAGALAIFTGAISIAQQAPVPKANPGAPAAPAPAAAPAAPVQQVQQTQQPQQTQAPQPTVTKQETFGDWIYACVEAPQTTEVRCSIVQQLSDAKTKATVFLFRIVQDGKGGLTGIWQTPEGVLLYKGITLDAGTEKPIVIPFQTCGRGRCQAVANLADDFVQSLATTEKAVATLTTPQGQAVNFTLSVNGLADGLAALQN